MRCCGMPASTLVSGCKIGVSGRGGGALTGIRGRDFESENGMGLLFEQCGAAQEVKVGRSWRTLERKLAVALRCPVQGQPFKRVA